MRGAFERPVTVLVGGGRWGRQLARVLDRLLPPSDPLVWISRHTQDWPVTAGRILGSERSIIALDGIGRLDSIGPVRCAIVATAVRDHARDVAALLDLGISVFVEKPVALDPGEAQALIAEAEAKGLTLGVDLEFCVAPFLRAFAEFARTCGEVTAAKLEWFDPPSEMRHGEAKGPDFSTPLCWDVFPHVWSILGMVLHDTLLLPRAVMMDADGSVTLTMGDDAIAVKAHLSRWATGRRRALSLWMTSGDHLVFDFTTEPGCLTINGSPEFWSPPPGCVGPLTEAVALFLAAVDGATDPFPLAANACQGAILGAAQADDLTRARALALWGEEGGMERTGTGWTAMLMELLLPAIARRDAAMARRYSQDPHHLIEAVGELVKRRNGWPDEPETLVDELMHGK